MDVAATALVEQLAFRHGRGYDSYLVVELNRQYFFSGGRQGLISFVRQGRYPLVIGGLLAPREHWPALVAEFLDFCRRKKYRPGFFNIDGEQAAVLREAGCEVTKVGEDAVVDLATCTWKGKDYEWVRRQTNFCQRQGLVVSEAKLDRLPSEERERLLAETVEISRDFLKQKPHGGQMRYFVGRYDTALIGRRRLFIARAEKGEGRIEGFLLCNPAFDGDCWAFEMFRQRHDAVRGTTPFLMHQAMLALAQEGVSRASLCMIPALHCQEPLEGDSGLLRWFMRMSGYLAPVYDLPGMYHFKSRFRPRFESCYLAAYPKATLWMLRASLMVWGADRMNPLRLAVRLVKQFFRRKSRATLAQPE